MTKLNTSKIFKEVRKVISKRSPEILTGIGIAGMITTVVLSVKATPRALNLIQEQEYEDDDGYSNITSMDKIKLTWKCYIPAATTGIFSIACLIGANSVHARRNAALATVYKLSESALSEYRDKVIDTLGEKKEKVIREKIDKDRIEKNPVSKNEVIITQRGKTLCYDSLSCRYFESDIDYIKKAENVLNKQMLHDLCGYVSINDFYDELGLDRTDPATGDTLGWNADHMIDISIGSQIADDGRPCIVISHNNPPFYEYDR